MHRGWLGRSGVWENRESDAGDRELFRGSSSDFIQLFSLFFFSLFSFFSFFLRLVFMFCCSSLDWPCERWKREGVG